MPPGELVFAPGTCREDNSGTFFYGWKLVMALSPSDSKQLKEELVELQNLNIAILKSSTFGGMTQAERSEYEARQKRIIDIVAALQREAG